MALAERVGQRTGTVFRLTRKGVMAALAKGYTLPTLWRLLEAQVAAPIPANVRTEVEAWARNVVRMAAHSAILLQVPDEATLQRLLDVGRNKVIRLGDLLVQLCGTPRELRQLVDRLQVAGLFVTLPELPATPSRRGRPPYRPR
ncbi:MAG: hypothetical protein OZSIB_3048 [Candidatus Ozemobacter sibiricus]|uniref:Helicase XPB/Ssl2 N-terminal domain-containing protein n=1 Tax=Candidatus Ozemobacter sibiricus TaxID=2268124 RepID=A0A367ZRG5_9BACT|nr:MAG: hypothetical protein OZSIB_3048 [Candidatus Ozemobacter sibiricus]